MCLSWLVVFHVLSIRPYLVEDGVDPGFFPEGTLPRDARRRPVRHRPCRRLSKTARCDFFITNAHSIPECVTSILLYLRAARTVFENIDMAKASVFADRHRRSRPDRPHSSTEFSARRCRSSAPDIWRGGDRRGGDGILRSSLNQARHVARGARAYLQDACRQPRTAASSGATSMAQRGPKQVAEGT